MEKPAGRAAPGTRMASGSARSSVRTSTSRATPVSSHSSRVAAREARARQELEAQKREREAVIRERELHLMALEERATRELQVRLTALVAAHDVATSRISDVLARTALRRRLRASHQLDALTASRSPRLRKALKSDVRKGTALVKRVAVLTDDTMDVLLRDIEGYNLSRYSVEMARSVIHERLRPQDVEHVVAVTAAMHQRYADFFPALFAVVCRDLRSAIGTLLGASPQQQQQQAAASAGRALGAVATSVIEAIDAAQVGEGACVSRVHRVNAAPSACIVGPRPSSRIRGR